jgi:RNA polymerase sigma factor (sigma-70 family)
LTAENRPRRASEASCLLGKVGLAIQEKEADLGVARGAVGLGRSDFELWSRVQRDDAEAFGLLFERHEKAIYNFCFRHVGDWAAAEELTSIVFLEAWRRRDKQLASGFVRAWLFGIATNVIRNRHRSERRHRAALARLPVEYRTPSFTDDADARLDAERAMCAILAGVKRLPRREKDVIALCVWSDLSYDEAATALGVPIGTIRSRLSRARRRLRELEPGRGHVQGEIDGKEDRA